MNDSSPAGIEQSRKAVWIISKYTSSAEYGFESRLFAIAREFVRNGRQTVVIASDSNHLATYPKFEKRYHYESLDGVDTWWIRTLRYAKTVSIRRILSWLDFELKLLAMPKRGLPAPDVIVVSSLSLLTILSGVWLRRRFRCKLVFEIRDIWPLTLVEEGGFSAWNPMVLVLGWIERFGYRRADLIIGTMPNLKAHVRNVTGEDLPCECVPFGFDPGGYANESPAESEGPVGDLPANRFIVGYAGSIGLTNALETIMECARRLAGDERFHFAFLGGGDRREHFIELTRDLPNVTFLPKVPRSEVKSVLARFDLLYFAVYDSPVWDFGMSLNKLIDYMMSAKPILASYSGYPSMLDESGCGEFVPSADPDALEAAIRRYGERDPEDLRRMGERGRAWLLNHRRWDILALEYGRLLDGLGLEDEMADAQADV